MNKRLKALVALRVAELKKIDSLLNKAETENRALAADEQTTHDTSMEEVRKLDVQIASTKELIAMRGTQDGLDTEVRGLGEAAPRSVSNSPVDFGVTEFSQQDLRELNSYSYVRAMRQMLTDGRLEGVEKTMHQEAVLEARSATGEGLQGNFGIPLKVLQLSGLNTRALTATGQTSVAGDQGGLAIQTNVGSIIERFYAKLMVKQMGVRVLDGLQGNILFPKHVTDDNAAVKGEVATSNVTSSRLSSVSMSPRRVPIVLEMSRQFMMQTSPSVEAYFRDDLAFQLAKIIDYYCINGSGASGQPYGILNTSGITQLYAGATVVITNGVPAITAPVVGTNANGAGMSYADTVLAVKAIANQNADIGKLGWLFNPNVKASLQLTPKIGSTFPTFVWPDNADQVQGYRAGVTTQMPANLVKGSSSALNAAIFGNWDDGMLGQWGGVDMLVNPYSKDDQGIIRINAWTFFDFAIRRAQSFCAFLDIAA